MDGRCPEWLDDAVKSEIFRYVNKVSGDSLDWGLLEDVLREPSEYDYGDHVPKPFLAMWGSLPCDVRVALIVAAEEVISLNRMGVGWKGTNP